MTQIEFIDKLSSCLSGKVSASTIQENISYYRQFFADEIGKGRSEEEICISLGSPQLIAKGILEAERFQSGNATGYTQEVNEELDYRKSSERWEQKMRNFQMPGWLVGIITVLIFFFVISLVLSVFSALAPLILPLCIVWFVIRIFKNLF